VEEKRGEGKGRRRREGTPIEMKAPNQNPKYAAARTCLFCSITLDWETAD